MNKDKEYCKDMIRQAIEAMKRYSKHNIAGYSERWLAWEFMEATLDNLPESISTHRKHMMLDYCDRIMSRLLDI